MKINEFAQKDWLIMVADLKSKTPDRIGGPKRYTKNSSGGNSVFFEGGAVPILYNCTEKKLYLWGTCRRNSGKRISLDALCTLHNLMLEWIDEWGVSA